jgi:hypothetical protein
MAGSRCLRYHSEATPVSIASLDRRQPRVAVVCQSVRIRAYGKQPLAFSCGCLAVSALVPEGEEKKERAGGCSVCSSINGPQMKLRWLSAPWSYPRGDLDPHPQISRKLALRIETKHSRARGLERSTSTWSEMIFSWWRYGSLLFGTLETRFLRNLLLGPRNNSAIQQAPD